MAERLSPAPAWAERNPDSPDLAEVASSWRSAYVHVPFCRRRCPYCDFAVVTPDEAPGPTATDRYVDAVIAEIAMEPPWSPLDAVNIGGGTPSALHPHGLRGIVDALERRFGFAAGVEVSLEANPEDWSDRLGAELVDMGISRISWGVQSFDAAVLSSLGRSHTPEQASAAVSGSQRAGLNSVSVDLIFGTPGETTASWQATVESALSLAPDHLSMYSLTVERGTALSRAVAAGAAAPDPDDQAEKYELAVGLAERAGLVHYEVSNLARSGHPCRYNLSTWGQGEYIAFGLGAHGHREGVRRRNVRNLRVYLDRTEAGERPEGGSERTDGWAAEQERLLLGLRRRAGVATGDGGRALLVSDEGMRLVAAGVLAERDGRLVVDRPLLTDAVSVAVLSLSP